MKGRDELRETDFRTNGEIAESEALNAFIEGLRKITGARRARHQAADTVDGLEDLLVRRVQAARGARDGVIRESSDITGLGGPDYSYVQW